MTRSEASAGVEATNGPEIGPLTTGSSKPLEIDRTNVLGVGVSAITLEMGSAEIGRWIRCGHKSYVCVTGVHGVIESQLDPNLRHIHNRAGLVTPDGMPLVWLSRLDGKRQVSRVYGPDLMLEVCRRGQPEGWRHFFYGTTDETLTKLIRNLQCLYPGIEIAGRMSPPFRDLTAGEVDEIASIINRASPDIVWVGLSTPKQEKWMHAFRGRLNATTLIGVGAAFDFHAGKVRQAPRWVQSSGMEWLFRLCAEPRRLWRRYLRNNPVFLVLTLAQLTGVKHFTMD